MLAINITLSTFHSTLTKAFRFKTFFESVFLFYRIILKKQWSCWWVGTVMAKVWFIWAAEYNGTTHYLHAPSIKLQYVHIEKTIKLTLNKQYLTILKCVFHLKINITLYQSTMPFSTPPLERIPLLIFKSIIIEQIVSIGIWFNVILTYLLDGEQNSDFVIKLRQPQNNIHLDRANHQ